MLSMHNPSLSSRVAGFDAFADKEGVGAMLAEMEARGRHSVQPRHDSAF